MTKCEILITTASIILSAFFSWIASAWYYKKANRETALNHIIVKIYTLIMNYPNKAGVDEFKQIIMSHELKYLGRKEYQLILQLFLSYKSVGQYSDTERFALILQSFYHDTIEKNDINTRIETVFDGINYVEEIIQPYKYLHCAKQIKEFLLENNIYYNLINEDNYLAYQCLINSFLNEMYLNVFNDELKIEFFESKTIFELVDDSVVMKYHKEKLADYNEKKNEFSRVFQSDIREEWSEFFLENEGYPF